jgi:hypothetical protein
MLDVITQLLIITPLLRQDEIFTMTSAFILLVMLVRVSEFRVLKDSFAHQRLNVGDLTSALGYMESKVRAQSLGRIKT